MNAFQKIEAKARELMASGQAANFDEALAEVVRLDPKLYKESLEEDQKPELPSEVKAALAVLTPGERAAIEANATQIFLRNRDCTEADSIMFAIQQTPSIHLKCSEASPVRKDTLEKIRAMRKSADAASRGDAYFKLQTIADGYRTGGMDSDEAWVQACEDNPKLFEEWQDSQPSPSRVQRVTVQGSSLEDRAAALVMAGQAASIDDAVDMVIAADPAAYTEYMKTMG